MPAWRIRSITSGDLMRGSSHGTDVARLGVRRAPDVGRHLAHRRDRRPAPPGPRPCGGTACTCGRCHTSTGRSPAAASRRVGWSATVRIMPPFYELSAPDEPSGRLKQTDREFRGRGGRSARCRRSRSVAEAVVEAARAALPELEHVGDAAATRPSAAGGARRTSANRSSTAATQALELGAVGDHLALRRRPRADLARPRAGGEVGVALGVVEPLDVPAHPNLAVQIEPAEDAPTPRRALRAGGS